MPALIFAGLNLGTEGVHGWGIPMATDTAFSLGILSMLASRVPPMLLVFLTAFAIVDDILAVLVIAVFYTDSISWPALGVAALTAAARLDGAPDIVRTRYRVSRITLADRIVIAASATAGLAVVLWSWWRPDAMAFRIYPELEVPVVEPVLMLLLSLLMAPAVVAVVPERAR